MGRFTSRTEAKAHFKDLLQQGARYLQARVSDGSLSQSECDANLATLRKRLSTEYEAAIAELGAPQEPHRDRDHRELPSTPSNVTGTPKPVSRTTGAGVWTIAAFVIAFAVVIAIALKFGDGHANTADTAAGAAGLTYRVAVSPENSRYCKVTVIFNASDVPVGTPVAIVIYDPHLGAVVEEWTAVIPDDLSSGSSRGGFIRRTGNLRTIELRVQTPDPYSITPDWVTVFVN